MHLSGPIVRRGGGTFLFQRDSHEYVLQFENMAIVEPEWEHVKFSKDRNQLATTLLPAVTYGQEIGV